MTSVKLYSRKPFKDVDSGFSLTHKPRLIHHNDRSLEDIRADTVIGNQRSITACQNYVDLIRVALDEEAVTPPELLDIILKNTKIENPHPLNQILSQSLEKNPSSSDSHLVNILAIMLETGKIDPTALPWLGETPTLALN